MHDYDDPPHDHSHEARGKPTFLQTLRPRLGISWLALEATQSVMLSFGA